MRDIEIINTELMLADLESVTKRRERVAKDAKRGDKDGHRRGGRARQARARRSTPANRRSPCELTPEEKAIARQFFLLTDKPTIFACNVKETDLATADANPHVMKVRDYVKTHLACEAVVISAQIESELIDLSPEEADEFLKELGVAESGVGSLIRATYHLLGLRTYFTAGEKEVRAWTIHTGDTAPKAAGRHPLRLRARLHQGRDRRLRRPRRAAARSPRPARRASTAWKARNTSSRTATCCCSSSTCRAWHDTPEFDAITATVAGTASNSRGIVPGPKRS